MSGILHILDQKRLIAPNGRNVGASIYFYTTGTLTPATVYADALLTTPLANPVVVAAGAQVPAIYLDPAVIYRRRIVWTDATLTPDDVDPYVVPVEGSVSSLRDFGAIGNGTADDTASVTAADAASGKKYVPAGTYDTTLAATDLDGPYWGEGQIRDAANNKRAPWFSAVYLPPTSFGNADSADTAFNGDLSKNQIAMEHRIYGGTTLGQPTTGYLYRPEAMPIYGYLYNESGWNQSTSGNSGRTGVAFQRVQVFQAGQGDAICYNASAFVTGTRAGSSDFLANPAAVLFNGDIEGGAAGVYLNCGEFMMRDGGHDVAAIGWVSNGVRTVSTGAKNAYWASFRAQSQGSAAMDQAFGFAGLFKVGFDGTPATLTADQALISGKAGQRIYLNNASSNGLYTTTFNGDYLEYSSGVGGFNFVRSGSAVFQITNDRVTFLQPPRLPTVTASGLPAAVSGNRGMEYYVSDSNSTTRGATVAGGGANFVKVYSNGTNWIIA